MPAIKSEFRKLISIRSTYGWLLLALVLVGIYSIYGEGFNDASNLLKSHTGDPGARLFLASTLPQIANFISGPGGIIALLLVAHEYRHNTITYTLTASNSRAKVLVSKMAVIFTFILFYSVILATLGPSRWPARLRSDISAGLRLPRRFPGAGSCLS